MKSKILVLSVLFFLSCSFIHAQLTDTLNFSTGYDNNTNTAIANGMNDYEWKITNVTSLLTPISTFPYASYVQQPWSIGFNSPVTPLNTGWISYDSVGMSVGSYDNIGGIVTFEYQFETSLNDTIQFLATIRSDNYVSEIRIDSIVTGFSQTPVSTNWTTGSSFVFVQYLTAGIHKIEVVVNNVGSGQTNNPVGLNINGLIVSNTQSIVPLTIGLGDIVAKNIGGNNNKITWKSLSEDEADYYELEKSLDCINFEKIKTIKGNGKPSVYTIIDQYGIEGTNYYRLKMLDVKGNYAYSKIVSANVTMNERFKISAYPNPANKNLIIKIHGQQGGNPQICMFDIASKLIKRIKIYGSEETINIYDIPNGIYLLKYFDDKQTYAIRVIKE